MSQNWSAAGGFDKRGFANEVAGKSNEKAFFDKSASFANAGAGLAKLQILSKVALLLKIFDKTGTIN